MSHMEIRRRRDGLLLGFAAIEPPKDGSSFVVFHEAGEMERPNGLQFDPHATVPIKTHRVDFVRMNWQMFHDHWVAVIDDAKPCHLMPDWIAAPPNLRPPTVRPDALRGDPIGMPRR